jgi:hypothetical protein
VLALREIAEGRIDRDKIQRVEEEVREEQSAALEIIEEPLE